MKREREHLRPAAQVEGDARRRVLAGDGEDGVTDRVDPGVFCPDLTEGDVHRVADRLYTLDRLSDLGFYCLHMHLVSLEVAIDALLHNDDGVGDLFQVFDAGRLPVILVGDAVVQRLADHPGVVLRQLQGKERLP